MAMSDSLLRCAHEQARTVDGSSCGENFVRADVRRTSCRCSGSQAILGSTTRFVSAADVGSAAIMGADGVGSLDGRIRRTRVDQSTGA